LTVSFPAPGTSSIRQVRQSRQCLEMWSPRHNHRSAFAEANATLSGLFDPPMNSSPIPRLGPVMQTVAMPRSFRVASPPCTGNRWAALFPPVPNRSYSLWETAEHLDFRLERPALVPAGNAAESHPRPASKTVPRQDSVGWIDAGLFRACC